MKAVRIIRACAAIAVPSERPRESAAWRIAAAALPEIEEKETLGLRMPMTRDAAAVEAACRIAARRIEERLDGGRDTAFLTLGDPSVFSTFGRLRRILAADGYASEAVPGVPSFCAAAARLGVPLAEGDEPLHIVPAASALPLPGSGSCVILKPAGRLREIRGALRISGRPAFMAEACGMPGERLFTHAEEFPDESGYFSLILVRPDEKPEPD